MPRNPVLSIDKKFAALCWPQTDEEKSLLTESIRKEGCREPIRYWKTEGNPIIDGHTRYAICIENKIPFTAIAVELESRQAAIDWIISNQLGRRNASETQKSHLRGMLYIDRVEAEAAKELKKRDEQPHAPQEPRPNIAKIIAAETGVSDDRIHRDRAFAKSMEKLATKSVPLRDAAIQGRIAKGDATIIADASIDVLKGIEKSPETGWRAGAKAVATAIVNHKPEPDMHGRVVIDIRPLAKMELLAGQLVRAKTASLEACGGRKCDWAWRHAEAIRVALGTIFDEILEWQKESAATKRKV